MPRSTPRAPHSSHFRVGPWRRRRSKPANSTIQRGSVKTNGQPCTLTGRSNVDRAHIEQQPIGGGVRNETEPIGANRFGPHQLPLATQTALITFASPASTAAAGAVTGLRSSANSTAKSSASRARPFCTRSLTISGAHPQISAISRSVNPAAADRTIASRSSKPRCKSAGPTPDTVRPLVFVRPSAANEQQKVPYASRTP